MNPQHYATYDLQHQQQLYAQGNMGVYTTQSGMLTSSRDSSVVPLHMWTPPSPQELQLYDQLFTYTDDQHRNSIGGQQAVAFFMRSHLEKTVLREIWTIADSQQKSNLSKNEFYVAMRLISMAQRGEQLSVQRFYQLAAMPYPLPKIEGVSPAIQIPSHIHAPVPVQVQVHTRQNVNAVHPQKPLSYALTAAEKRKYELVFQQYDTDHDGFLLRTEAVTLFQMSGLDRNILREIWSMADVTQDSKLNIQEFYVAMHLIVCLSKRGLPMPPTLPRELRETAFGADGSGPVVSGHGFGSYVTGSPSQIGLVRQQQESAPVPEPEGMSAFDALSTTGDAPLPSLQSSFPRSSREDFLKHNDANRRNSQFGDGKEPSAPTPTGSMEQHDFNSFPTPRTPSVVGRDRTNSASSLSSMSSFGGLTPRPSQQPTHQLPLRNFGNNEHIKMQADNPNFQAYPALGGMGFGGHQQPVTSLEKPFMSDEEEKKLVGKLDQQNQEIGQTIASVERKQATIEMVSEKLRDLDELRQELVTLVMKRENMRAASAYNSEATDTSAEEQTRHAVERSLRSLLENQKRLVHQLKYDISRYEGELEEVILNAKLQQKMSLGSQSPLIDAATAPLSGHDSSRAEGSRTTVFSGTPLIIDGSNTVPSSVAVPNSPSFSAFSPDATDSSGFNAFSNFDSAPRSLASATPSPAGAGMVPSGSLFSLTPSPSQSASGNDMFDVFGSYAAPSSTGVGPSTLSDVDSTPGKSLFPPSSSTTAVSESADFDAFNAVVPLSAADAGVSPSTPATNDATSPFSPFSPSPVAAAVNDGGFPGFGGFKAASSSLPAAAATRSSPDLSLEPIPSGTAAPVNLSSFSPTALSAVTETPVFDAFATAPFSNDDTTTSANTAVAEKLILSPAAADNNRLNAFDDFGDTVVSTDNAVEFCELVSKQESSGDLLFSPTPSPVAATEPTSFDTFGDFSAPPTSSGSSASVHTSEKASGSLLFSPIAADGNDYDNFGGFNAAPASADRTAPLSASEKSALASSSSLLSPVAKDENASGCGDFSVAPASTDAAATPSEAMQMTDRNGNPTALPVVADSSESEDAFNSGSVTVDSTKSADVSDNSDSSPFSPVGGGFELIGDLNTTAASVDSAKSAAERGNK